MASSCFKSLVLRGFVGGFIGFGGCCFGSEVSALRKPRALEGFRDYRV